MHRKAKRMPIANAYCSGKKYAWAPESYLPEDD